MSKKEFFDQIIKSLKSNPSEAIREMGKLYPDRIEEFNLYLSNAVLHEESSRYRGKVIEMSIYLENLLAKFLSFYFAIEPKRELLNSVVFDRMDLQRKLNTVKTLLKNEHPKLWIRYNSEIKKIDKLISFRNNLAHSILNSTTKGKNDLLLKVKELERVGSDMVHLDEIEYGFFENHSWVFRKVTFTQVNEYIQDMNDSIELIEEIGYEIIPGYERSTIKMSM